MSKEFGNKIYQLRKALGLTQQDIADAINVDRSTYSNYERGVTEPDLKTLKRIADILNVSVDVLLSDKNDVKKVADRSDMPMYNLPKSEKLLLVKYRILTDEQKKAGFDYIDNLPDANDE